MNRTREGFEDPDQALELKTITPLILYDTFFMGLDEMHIWGANLGPKIWNVISEGENLALSSENPLFLKKRYRELISKAALKCQKSMHSGAMNGAFIDMESKPGTVISVDWIDFIVHLLPTTVVEAIQLQKYEVRHEEEARRSENRKTNEELLTLD
ncbi:hypothetical protein MAM1_0191d07668 [Mucor ambiguus]|uniref:Uncharacterized protein n=1 Tax=Mucor ambiguus TaxID=91626 RepID=A0A0C9MC30_9FUNG|nr:hypothetical protein MAM1_0191d07668 [Mucor ambiguus]